MSIDAASNVFSGSSLPSLPECSLEIYGSQLSTTTQTVATLPLPLSNGTVSATVNGVSAPLYYVSIGGNTIFRSHMRQVRGRLCAG